MHTRHRILTLPTHPLTHPPLSSLHTTSTTRPHSRLRRRVPAPDVEHAPWVRQLRHATHTHDTDMNSLAVDARL